MLSHYGCGQYVSSSRIATFYRFGWQDWLVVAWAFVKVGLLALAGLLLGIANEDLKSLEQSNETLREIIGKLQDGR